MGFIDCFFYYLRLFINPNSIRNMEWKMLILLNKDRKKNGLQKLIMQDDLRQVARKHSIEMARLDYFEHENPYGKNHTDRYKKEGISEAISGENLAKIGGYDFPVQRAEKGLMESPGHRANILNGKYNVVGIGIHKAENKNYYFTQNFAYRTLLFTSNIPNKIKIHKKLKITFRAQIKIHSGFYKIKYNSGDIETKKFFIYNVTNKMELVFHEIGIVNIDFFTNSNNLNQHYLTNSFKLLVTID